MDEFEKVVQFVVENIGRGEIFYNKLSLNDIELYKESMDNDNYNDDNINDNNNNNDNDEDSDENDDSNQELSIVKKQQKALATYFQGISGVLDVSNDSKVTYFVYCVLCVVCYVF